MEKYLSQVGGIDGRGCVLRTLCEMSQEQRHADGLLGDAMNLLLTPMHMLKSLSNTDAYIRAQQDGHWNQDCGKYHRQCPVSLFEVWNQCSWSRMIQAKITFETLFGSKQ